MSRRPHLSQDLCLGVDSDSEMAKGDYTLAVVTGAAADTHLGGYRAYLGPKGPYGLGLNALTRAIPVVLRR